MQAAPRSASADSAFVQFRAQYLRWIDTLQSAMWELASAKGGEGDLERLLFDRPGADEQLRARLRRHGFELADDGEGGYFIDEDMAYLAVTVDTLVSPGMREFLRIRGTEQRVGFSGDATLQISFIDLALRVATWEHFLATYPGFMLRAEADAWYHVYLRTYLTGMDNSRVFSDDGSLLPEVRESYEFFIDYSSTASGDLVRRYYEILRANGFRYGPGVQRFLDENGIETMLGVQPPIR